MRAWAMPRSLHLFCGIPFPVKTPGIIFGLTSVKVWLSRKISGDLFTGWGGGKKNLFEGRANF